MQNLGGQGLVEAMVSSLEKSLPPVFARKEIPRFLGGSLAVGTLANLGKAGPPYMRCGKHAMYEKSTFLTWFREWLGGEANHSESSIAPSGNS